MKELLDDIRRWRDEGEDVVVATVVGTRRSAPRPVGSAGAASPAPAQPATAYPCYPKEILLGDAAAKEVYCETDPKMPVTQPYG